jgi:tRNA nucleotidyltransferase/poly(A) polymerase
MQIYLVGGAVRDSLLGLPITEKDWVVVGSTPDELLALGFKPVGRDFPVFLHPQTHEEYALARTERKTGRGYTQFSCFAAPTVSLEDDLKRRDLTINAIAQSEEGQLIDPYGGQADLSQRLLRHVSDAFAEDPVRILRIARFAARFAYLGFTIADETQILLRHMVDDGEVDTLVAERVWQELEKALGERNPEVFFHVLNQCGALPIIFPELNPSKISLYEAQRALSCACQFTQTKRVRLAAWLSLACQDNAIPSFCQRHRLPKAYTELAIGVANYQNLCDTALTLTPEALVRLLKNLDAVRNPQRFQDFLLACTAIFQAHCAPGLSDAKKIPSTYPPADFLPRVVTILRDVKIESLIAQGLTGAALGEALHNAQITAVTDGLKSQ